MGAFDYLEKKTGYCRMQLYKHADPKLKIRKPQPPRNPIVADRVRWRHIQRLVETCDRECCQKTARRLSMHRRTLATILAKRAPRWFLAKFPHPRIIEVMKPVCGQCRKPVTWPPCAGCRQAMPRASRRISAPKLKSAHNQPLLLLGTQICRNLFMAGQRTCGRNNPY